MSSTNHQLDAFRLPEIHHHIIFSNMCGEFWPRDYTKSPAMLFNLCHILLMFFNPFSLCLQINLPLLSKFIIIIHPSSQALHPAVPSALLVKPVHPLTQPRPSLALLAPTLSVVNKSALCVRQVMNVRTRTVPRWPSAALAPTAREAGRPASSAQTGILAHLSTIASKFSVPQDSMPRYQ